ncbi:MAG: thermonuclease family protein [Rhizobiaceae bacterium]
MADILDFRTRRKVEPRPWKPRRRHTEDETRERPGSTLRRSYGLVLLAAIAGVAVWGQAKGVPMPAMFSAPDTGTASRSFTICGAGKRIDCVVDGDTFYMRGEKIRIADIDTPEVSSPKCASEKLLGDRATARLQMLLNGGPIELRSGQRDRDRYGRLLRTVHRNDHSLGDTLIAEGLARPYDGGRRSWCG